MSSNKVVSIEDLLEIMAMLRDAEHGCPWDRKQTFKTIAPHTLEEVYEVVDTIEQEDYSHLANELGDLLFQVVFYAQLGREQGLFEFSDIVNQIGSKLLNRHPHVFPDATMESFGAEKVMTADQVEGKWEEIKRRERQAKSGGSASVLDDVPLAFPALTRARKIQKRAATVGFDWPDGEGVVAKLQEEMIELKEAVASGDEEHIQEELGDVYFSLVNLSRHLKKDPETSLRRANEKFENRFRRVEKKINAKGLDMRSMSLQELEQIWQEVKQEEITG